MEQNDGDLIAALEDEEELLNTAGHVLPVTLEATTLHSTLRDGTVVVGETALDRPARRSVSPIADVFLQPRVRAFSRARKALERADREIIGPGDLFTSIIPCLLVDGIPDAIRSSDEEVIYVCNVMTKHGETDGFRASDFVREIHRYLGRRLDTVLVNTVDVPPDLASRYAEEAAYPVEPDLEAVRALVPRVLAGRFSSTEHLIRHDAERVVLAIWPELVT